MVLSVPDIICCFSSCILASNLLYSSGRYCTTRATVWPAP